MPYKALNRVGLPWSGTHQSLMEFYCTYIHAEWNDSNYAEIISVSHVMLPYGHIGNSIYDMIMLLSRGRGNYESQMLPLLEKFCESVKVFDFIKTVRNMLFNPRFDSPYGISTLMTIGNLVIEGYNLGTVVGVASENELVVFSDELDPLQLETFLVIILNGMVRDQLPSHLKFSEKKQAKFAKYLAKNDNQGIIKQLRTLPQKRVVDYFNDSRASSKYSYFNNFYNEISDDFFIHNDFVITANWGRENTIQPTSVTISLWKSLTSNIFSETDLLKRREIYVRDNGVRLNFNTPQDGIESISLREYHAFEPHEEHLLLITYHNVEKTSRLLPVDLTSLDKTFIPVQYEKDVSVLFMVLAWLGVLTKIDITLDKFLANDIPENEAIGMMGSMNETVNSYIKMMDEVNITYVVPFHWNYSVGSSKQTPHHGTEPVYTDKLKKIGRYTRKLPLGQKASPEAKAFAKKVFIELEEGMTIVEEFERKQRIRLN
jgi:hypothetical protein